MKKSVLLCAVVGLFLVSAFSQTEMPGPQERRMPPGEGVMGKVTAVSSDSVTVATMNGGAPVTIKASKDTRIMKDRQPIKLSEIKVDDMVFARGELNGNSMNAVVLGVVNPEMMQRMQQGGMAGGMRFNREDLGKKFIAGEVKAINETKLTIARPDNQTQEIEVDENTSFKRRGESITLADIKIGDFVHGEGELKGGVFVPKELMVGRPRMIVAPPGGDASEQKKPDSQTPPPAPPKN